MKILVVRFSSLGDLILTTGVLKAFKEQFPESQLTLLTYTEYAGLLKRSPFIDEVLTINRNDSLGAYIGFLKSHLSNFQYVVDLHGSLRSRLILFFKFFQYVSYKKKSFLRRLFVSFRLFKYHLQKHVTERYAEPFNKKLGLKYDNKESLRPFLTSDTTLTPGKIVIHPFASKRTKEWPYFEKLSEKLLEKGYNVTFIGAGNLNVPNGAEDLIGKTNLDEMLNEISSAELLVSSDSGPMHAGVALGRKTLAIFGPTTKEFGFYPQFNKTKVLEAENLDCRPCHVHGLNQCPKGHFKCMKEISVETTLNAIEKLINI